MCFVIAVCFRRPFSCERLSYLGCKTNLRKIWNTIAVWLMFPYWCSLIRGTARWNETLHPYKSGTMQSRLRVWLKQQAFFTPAFHQPRRALVHLPIPSSSHHMQCHTVITMVTSVTTDRLSTDPRVTINFAKRFTGVSPPSVCQGFTLVGLANNGDGYSD